MKTAKFRYPWRTYQQRVLDKLKTHMEDKKLYVVAPPGSGKTVLGLEVAKRLGKPTLILAPNLTIRNQWIQRFQDDFLQGKKVDWISQDIKNPKFLTISTYQALHAAHKRDDANLFTQLLATKIKTVVVDECHHLKNEWWQSLTKVVDCIKPTIVSLTATPPYDSSAFEWNRYQELCGEVDAEISVPELVADGNLCPHQDYIYFSLPTEKENDEITKFRKQIEEFLFDLKGNKHFIKLVQKHAFMRQPQKHLEAIYEQPDYFSSMLIFLHAMDVAMPLPAVEILGTDITELPPLSLEWLNIFLNQFLLKDESIRKHIGHVDVAKVKRQLRQMGAFERKKIELLAPSHLNKKLRSSSAKLNSILDIIQTEYDALKEDLRMVILTDYIRKELLPNHEYEVIESEQIGISTIFEKVRKKYPIEIELGVLSGSLIIIPRYAEKLFDTILGEKGIDKNDLQKIALPHEKDHYEIKVKAKLQGRIVGVITELFSRGGMTVLIGTKSLLGEGWDAPAINSLVLATVVGSYVLSNQMRGRAIRTLKTNKNKTANIWHLVCLDPFSGNGGEDFKILTRRFKAFHGVSFADKPMIENGIDRFLLPQFPLTKEKLITLNKTMTHHAQNRLRLQRVWTSSLKHGLVMVEEIKVPVAQKKSFKKVHEFLWKSTDKDFNQKQSWLHNLLNISTLFTFIAAAGFSFLPIGWLLTALITALFAFLVSFFHFDIRGKWKQFMSIGLTFGADIVKHLNRKLIGLGVLFIVAAIIIVVVQFWHGLLALAVAFLIGSFGLQIVANKIDVFRIIDIWKLYEKHGNIEAEIQQMGMVVLRSLTELRIINTPLKDLKLKTQKDEQGEVVCFLKGANNYEEHLFMESLQEVVNPVDNPRYLLKISKNWLDEFAETTYLSLPSILSKRKKESTIFLKHWVQEIGEAKLVFTRQLEGRKELLKARGQTLSLNSHPKAERLSAWK